MPTIAAHLDSDVKFDLGVFLRDKVAMVITSCMMQDHLPQENAGPNSLHLFLESVSPDSISSC